MSHWSESAVTDVGVTMLNEYMAGRKLTITAAYGGAGLVDADKLTEQTSLLEQKQTLNIVEVADAPSGKTLTIQVHNKDLAEEYSLSQIGVYAKLDGGEDETEKLLFITQDRSPVLIPPESEESFVFGLYYNVGITNTGRFHVTIDAAGVVTLERLRREMGAPGGIATLGEDGILTESQRPDLTPIQTQIDAIREGMEAETQGELLEVTLTNTLSSPFNSTMDSPETVALTQTRNNLFYTVETEVKEHTGQVGEIIISGKALNGFKIAYTGSGSSVTLTVRIKGGMT